MIPLSLPALRVGPILATFARLASELAANYAADTIMRAPIALAAIDLVGSPSSMLLETWAGVQVCVLISFGGCPNNCSLFHCFGAGSCFAALAGAVPAAALY